MQRPQIVSKLFGGIVQMIQPFSINVDQISIYNSSTATTGK